MQKNIPKGSSVSSGENRQVRTLDDLYDIINEAFAPMWEIRLGALRLRDGAPPSLQPLLGEIAAKTDAWSLFHSETTRAIQSAEFQVQVSMDEDQAALRLWRSTQAEVQR